MAAWADPTGSWKQTDMDQQLLRREMKVASGMMWNQDASKIPDNLSARTLSLRWKHCPSGHTALEDRVFPQQWNGLRSST